VIFCGLLLVIGIRSAVIGAIDLIFPFGFKSFLTGRTNFRNFFHIDYKLKLKTVQNA
jgi:hypothetical protein